MSVYQDCQNHFVSASSCTLCIARGVYCSACYGTPACSASIYKDQPCAPPCGQNTDRRGVLLQMELFGLHTPIRPLLCIGHIMRNCPAGVVRPLGSPAAHSAQAAGPSAARSSATTAATSSEPLLASSPGGVEVVQAGGVTQESARAAVAEPSEEDAQQHQLSAAEKPVRTRKASKSVINAALQTVADTQVRGCTPF